MRRRAPPSRTSPRRNTMSRIIKSAEHDLMQTHSDQKARLKAYVKGDLTWAELEGMTFEQARGIAQVGCDLAEAGRVEEARVLFEGLVEGNPHDAAARAALGTLYQ